MINATCVGSESVIVGIRLGYGDISENASENISDPNTREKATLGWIRG